VRHVNVAVPVIVLLLGAATGCSGSGDTSTALYPVGNDHHLCAPATRRNATTEGFDTFANRGPAPVTITSVEWPTSGDIRVDSIRVFRRQKGDQFATVGLWDGLPQDVLTGSERRAWERAQPAEGADLEEADAEEGYLVFVVGLTGTKGVGGPLTVTYTDGDGHSGTATSLVQLRVAKRCGGA